jgi:hypothetical protein
MKRALLVVCAAALLSAIPLSAAVAEASFADPAGDAGDAPDITAVQVSDDTGGNILFHVAVTNFTPESEVVIWLDTDRNASTGDLGFDYQLGLAYSVDSDNSGWWLGQFANGSWREAPSYATVKVFGNSTYADFRLNRSDLGNTSGFGFQVQSIRYTADAVTAGDTAPDGGLQTFTYALTVPAPAPTPTPVPAPTPKPAVVKPVFGPARITPGPVAGKKVVFTLAVNRSDTGAPLTTGKMICDPSVTGKVIRHAESFKGGTARLGFTIPKTAKGKVLKVKVKIVNGSASATRIVTYKVR